MINENIGQHLMDHSVFSIMVRTTPENSMHKHTLNITDIEACEAEYHSKGSGVYTGIAGATNAFQEYSNEKLKSLKADAVITAGYANQATVEFLFEAMFYPVAPTAAHAPAPDGSYFSITASSLVPLSEGNVTIRSASMADAPVINPNVCSHSLIRIAQHHMFCLLSFDLSPNSSSTTPTPQTA